jgi:hypothetical protein
MINMGDNIYECERCHYHSPDYSHFTRHLKRKVPCDATYSDKPLDIILKNLEEQKCSKKNYKCTVCDKAFSHVKSLCRHISEQHAQNITNNTSQSHNDNSINQSYNTTNNNTTNNNTTNNITNNYNINPVINIEIKPFGEESLEHVLENKGFLTNCLSSVIRQGVVDLFKEIYMNDSVQENQNIQFKRVREPPLVNVFLKKDNGTADWKETEAHPIIEKIVTKCVGILIDHKNFLVDNIETLNMEQVELNVQRQLNLLNIRNKKKGCYVPIRNNILGALKRNDKVNETT